MSGVSPALEVRLRFASTAGDGLAGVALGVFQSHPTTGSMVLSRRWKLIQGPDRNLGGGCGSAGKSNFVRERLFAAVQHASQDCLTSESR